MCNQENHVSFFQHLSFPIRNSNPYFRTPPKQCVEWRSDTTILPLYMEAQFLLRWISPPYNVWWGSRWGCRSIFRLMHVFHMGLYLFSVHNMDCCTRKHQTKQPRTPHQKIQIAKSQRWRLIYTLDCLKAELNVLESRN